MLVMRKRFLYGPRVLALGTFDGVHRGHTALLHTAADYAELHGIPLRVCTFDRHPLEMIRPEAVPPLLTTIPEKAAQLMRQGADETYLIPFFREVADLEPETFLDVLRETAEIRAVVAGWNYTFGKNGRGTAETLREDGRRHGYDVLIEPPFRDREGTAVSSSLVRECLDRGDVSTAAALLGRQYSVGGTVAEPDRHPGRRFRVTLPERKALPADGRYGCTVSFGNIMMRAEAGILRGEHTAEIELTDAAERPAGEKCRISFTAEGKKSTKKNGGME